jgi:hypothetical protein
MLREFLEDFETRPERQAWKFAKRKHDDTGAKRKASGKPYFVHPEESATILKNAGASQIEILSSLMHDLVEDAGATLEDVEEKFGKKVASIVAEVTNDRSGIAKLGKEEYLNQKMLNLSNEALTVKLADMLSNVKDSPKPEQKERILKNAEYALKNRKLTPIQNDLIDKIELERDKIHVVETLLSDMLGDRPSVHDLPRIPQEDEVDYNYYTEEENEDIPIFNSDEEVLDYWNKNGKCKFRMYESLTSIFNSTRSQ